MVSKGTNKYTYTPVTDIPRAGEILRATHRRHTDKNLARAASAPGQRRLDAFPNGCAFLPLIRCEYFRNENPRIVIGPQSRNRWEIHPNKIRPQPETSANLYMSLTQSHQTVQSEFRPSPNAQTDQNYRLRGGRYKKQGAFCKRQTYF